MSSSECLERNSLRYVFANIICDSGTVSVCFSLLAMILAYIIYDVVSREIFIKDSGPYPPEQPAAGYGLPDPGFPEFREGRQLYRIAGLFPVLPET
jgi:hypothetical protein